MFELDGKQYVPANPDKKLVSTKIIPDIYLLTGDTVHLTYSQKTTRDAEPEIKYEQIWQAKKEAVCRFKVNTYDDTSYDLIHSVDYIKEVAS